MERVRKVNYVANLVHPNLPSCYDNSTFMHDSEMEISKRNYNPVPLIEEKDEELENELSCMCSKFEKNDKNCVVDSSEPDRRGNYLCHASNVSSNSSNIFYNNDNHEDDNNDHRNDDKNYNNDNNNNNDNINNNDKHEFSCVNINHNAASKIEDENRIKKLPPERKQDRIYESCMARKKMRRAISDTRNPMEFTYLNRKMHQIEINNAKKINKKLDVKGDYPSLGTIHAAEAEDNPKSIDAEKAKNNSRRWFRKLSRYATVDEQDMYFTSQSTNNLIRSQSMEHFSEEDSFRGKSVACEQCKKPDVNPQRKFSRGKMIKQSVTQGLSKFKQFSLSSRYSNRKYEQTYSVIDNAEIIHETSKRLRNPLKKQETMPDFFEVPDYNEEMHETATSMRRCISVPECIDSSSECDEELSDLYLPRRMAICPDLPVPAMKQLRTYLVLTRLKQYCIV